MLFRSDAAAKALEPYTKDKSIFQNLAANPALSGRKPSDIANPGTTILFYEQTPAAAGRGVVYLDAHTERVTAERWQELKKAGKLP